MNDKEIWLLKSSNQILGPFTFERVIELLRGRQIAIIDEIRDHRSRWTFLREHKQFQDEVQKIRDLQSRHGDETSTHVAGNSDKTAETELTPVPTRSGQAHSEQHKSTIVPPGAKVTIAHNAPPIMGMPQHSQRFDRKMLLQSLLIAALLAGVFVYTQKQSKRPQVLEQPRISMNFYDRLNSLALNRETVALRNMITEAPWNDSQKVLATAVTYIDEGLWDTAREWLNKAPESWQKQYNQIVLSLLSNDESYREKLNSLVQPQMPTPLLLLKMYDLYKSGHAADKEVLSWKQDQIEEPYRSKYWLLRTLIEGVEGDSYKKLFMLSPNEDVLFLQNLELADGPLDWNALASDCVTKWNLASASERVRAVTAFCHLKKGDYVSALEVIKGGLVSNPYHQELNLLESFVYSQTQQYAQANVILTDKNMKENALLQQVKAINCLAQKDYACSQLQCEKLAESAFKLDCLYKSAVGLGNTQWMDDISLQAKNRYPTLLSTMKADE